jgi:hypothetical protein
LASSTAKGAPLLLQASDAIIVGIVPAEADIGSE